MNSTVWKYIAELGGIAAVVASLIFVGLQLRQNQEIALAEISQNALESVVEINNDFHGAPLTQTQRGSRHAGEAAIPEIGTVARVVLDVGRDAHAALIFNPTVTGVQVHQRVPGLVIPISELDVQHAKDWLRR